MCDHPLVWDRYLKACSEYEEERKKKHRLDITNEEKESEVYRAAQLEKLGLHGERELKTKKEKPLKKVEAYSLRKSKEYDDLFDDSEIPMEIKLKREEILQESHGWLIIEKDKKKLRKISPALAKNYIYEKDGWGRRHVMARFKEDFIMFCARKKLVFADPESEAAKSALRQYWRENYYNNVKRSGNPKMPLKFALDGVEISIRSLTDKGVQIFLKKGKKVLRWHAERLGYDWSREKPDMPTLEVMLDRR